MPRFFGGWNRRFSTGRLFFIVTLFSPIHVCAVSAQPTQTVDLSFLTTRAERTGYTETTRYDELVGFLEVAAAQSPHMVLTTFGYSSEGRALPLIIYGDAADGSADEIRASGKAVIYVQGNIHAGEVCGKEALLMLIRDLASGVHSEWRDSLILLLAPIYNADGNERISLFNRPRQNGPYGGMGQRPNAQGLDLNRDHMKVKSPEARSLIALMNEYDPHMLVDLHTTNGSQHAYHVTYSPPLNPNTAMEIDSFLRGDMLPEISRSIREKHGWEYYYYGNLPFRNATEPGWFTFDHRPRFNNNYVGLRNRVAILSEAYAYASFEERVLASLYFVEEILSYSHAHKEQILGVVESASKRVIVGEQLAVRSDFQRSAEPVDILLGETRNEKNPFSGEMVRVRQDVQRAEKMYEYGTFAPTETARVPSRYFVSPDVAVVREYLEIHGISYSQATAAQEVTLDVFTVDSTQVAERPFQDIQERTLFGAYRTERRTLEAGTLVVSMTQPLARLVFYLLEPRSDDGLVNWAQMDSYVSGSGEYPIFKSVD